MTKLSVNLNKIALLRNSRGRDFPNVVAFAKKFIALGVQGITVHPREDERHITRQDAIDLGQFLAGSEVEFNIEGYPSQRFLDLIELVKPTQATLVPDAPDQLTSDHGWDLEKDGTFVKEVCIKIAASGVRTAIFLDPDVAEVKRAPLTGVDRIELYTETYASSYGTSEQQKVWEQFNIASIEAQKLGIEVNAGHDLELTNLAKFLEIENILEVSIGHVLTVECIEQGMTSVVEQYLKICNA
jgi:pyridoxine 5-phosphate synthase